MSYLKISDSANPQYIVVIVHSEYEQTSYLFVSEASARVCYNNNKRHGNEVYLARIMEQPE